MGLTNSKVHWGDIPGTIYQLSQLMEQSSLLDGSEKACLRDYFGVLVRVLSQTDSGFPWARPDADLENTWKSDPILLEYFRRVHLAIPKSDQCGEIFRWSDDPSFNSVEGLRGFEEDFSRAPRRIQIGLSHLYALFLFLWSVQKKENPSERFYKSDIPYYMYQSEQGYNSMRIEILLNALEKVEVAQEIGELNDWSKSVEKCGQCVEWKNFLREKDDSSDRFLCDKHKGQSSYELSESERETSNQGEIIEKLDRALHRLQVLYDLLKEDKTKRKAKK